MSELLINSKAVFNNVESVVFDKDGTLIDIHHYWSSMIRIRASFIAKKLASSKNNVEIEDFLIDLMGVDLSTGKMKSSGPVGVKSRGFIVDMVTDALHLKGVDTDREEIESIFLEVDRETSKDILPLLRLLPGVEDFLTGLKKCGVIMIVASTDVTSRTKIAMEALRIDHFFSKIFGGDAVDNSKPSPDLVVKAIKECNLVPNNLVVIGDHPVDIKMGLSANSGLNIGVLTGLSNISSFSGLNCIAIDNLKRASVRC